MSDFTDEIVKTILSNYKSFKNREAIREMIERAKKGDDFGRVYKCNRHLSEKIAREVVTALNAIDGELYQGTLIDVLKPCLEELHTDINAVCAAVQNNKNIKAGVQLKPQTTKYSGYNAVEMGKALKGRDDADELTGKILEYASNVADKIQRKNIEFLANNADSVIIVTRKYDGVGLHDGKKVCKFCTDLEGTRKFSHYWDCMNDDIWRRHEGCGCYIDYENKYTGTRTKGVKNYR